MKITLLTCLFFFLCFSITAAYEVELEEVVVTATKNPTTLKDVPVKTEVITAEEIEASNVKNITESLRSIPGFYTRGENIPGSSYWTTRLRGLPFDSGYGLVLIDGERVHGGAMGEYGISIKQLPPEMVDRIEVVKGPSSVLYGSDALAGIVNIITKPIPEKPFAHFSIGYGSYDTMEAGISVGRKIVDTGFLISAQSEGSERGRYGATEDEYTGRHVLAKVSQDISNRFKASLKLAYDKETWKTMIEEKERVSPALEYRFAGNSLLEVKGYWYKEWLDSFSPGYTRRTGDIFYSDGEIRYVSPFGTSHIVTLGGEYLRRDIDANFADETDWVWSLYGQDEITLFTPLKLIVGGRLDDNSLYGLEFSPRGGVLWNINETTQLRASVGRGFKSPTIRQLYVFFKHGNYWNIPNKDLSPETSWGYSLDLEHHLSSLLSFNVTLFRNDLEDMIVSIETPQKIDNVPVKTWKNVRKAYTQGLEGACILVPLDDLSLKLGYAFLDTKNKDVDKELPYAPNHLINITLSYRIEKIDTLINWNSTFYSKSYTNELNTQKIKAYSVHGLRISKDVTQNISLSFDIDNIFNSDYGEPSKEWLGRVFFGKINLKF